MGAISAGTCATGCADISVANGFMAGLVQGKRPYGGGGVGIALATTQATTQTQQWPSSSRQPLQNQGSQPCRYRNHQPRLLLLLLLQVLQVLLLQVLLLTHLLLQVLQVTHLVLQVTPLLLLQVLLCLLL